MFSATFAKEIQQLAADYMNDYLFLKVGRVGSTTTNITQVVKWIDNFSKRDELLKDLSATQGKTLIFAERKRDADQLARFLFQKGIPATAIHGNRRSEEHTSELQSLMRISYAVF